MDTKGSGKSGVNDAGDTEPLLRKHDTGLEDKEEHMKVSKYDDDRGSARDEPAGTVLYSRKDDTVDMTMDTKMSEAKFKVQGYRLERRERSEFGGVTSAVVMPDSKARSREALETPQLCFIFEDEADNANESEQKQQYFAQIARECTIIHETGIVLYNTGSNSVAQLISHHQLSKERSVFSIKILEAGETGEIGIGLVQEKYPENCMPGWVKNSVGYHADDGGIYEGEANFSSFFGPATKGDVMSIEVDKARKVGYFKRNSEICTAVTLKMRGLYPCIGIRSIGAAVQIMESNVWEPENDDSDHHQPDALPLYSTEELLIGPAEEIILLQSAEGTFCGWLLLHNRGRAWIYFKVIYGEKADYSHYGILEGKEDWLEHLEIKRDDCRDAIIIEWTLLDVEYYQRDPLELTDLLGPENEHKNCHKLSVKRQELEERAIEEAEPVNANLESKELLQYLESASRIQDNNDKTVKKVEELAKAADNLDIKNESGYTALHLAAEHRFIRIARVLLDSNADPHVINGEGELPLDIALRHQDDQMAELFVRKMKKKSVCALFWNETAIKLTLKDLMDIDCKKTVSAVLDSFQLKRYYCFAPLELDDSNQNPTSTDYNYHDLTAYQKIARQDSNELCSHEVIKALTERKWDLYAKKEFIIMALVYLLSVFSITFAAITGVVTDDVTQYNTPVDVARAVFEAITLLFAINTFIIEEVQITRDKSEYFKDVYNYMELGSSALILSVFPLRYTYCQEQWYVFAVGYILWGFRIFKYAAVFRKSGIFGQILLRLIIIDVPQFIVLFLVILVSFSGGLFLSLKGDNNLAVHSETSTFEGILFVGIRTLTEAEPVVDYTGQDGYRIARHNPCVNSSIFYIINVHLARFGFTELTEDELRGLTMGIYQLKQAKSYTDEHFDEKGSYEIMAQKEDDGVLKAQIRLGYYHNETENSEAKPSKMHIDYVKDAAVDTWSTSSDSEEDE